MSEEKKVMSIVLEDGSIDEVEVLLSFEFTDTKKEYIIYTKNETDDNGNVTIYVASLIRNDDSDPVLGGVETDEEWSRIKNVLKELSKPDEDEEKEEEGTDAQ
ncbi:MAG: DUF1292 domain-containing protein [Bacilli bacterium]|nr:DUF1292 domain-containing protein [Bacilli bacterium]